MEPPLSYSLFSLFLLIIFLVIFLKNKRDSKPAPKLPPGPWPLPFIGNIHNLFGSLLPHQALRNLSRRYGSVIFLRVGEIPTVVLSSPDAIREIMKTHDITFSARPITGTTYTFTYGGKGVLFTPYGEYWQQMRKICSVELLGAKRVQLSMPVREEEVGNLIRQISYSSSQGQVVDLSERMARMVNDTVSRVILGSKCKSQDIFFRELAVAVELMAGFSLADIFPSSWLMRLISGAGRRAKRSQRVLDCIIDDVIKERRDQREKNVNEEEGEEDLLGVLLRMYDAGTEHNFLDIDSVKALIVDLFMAGSETSSTALMWIMSEIIRNPRVMKKAQSEIRELVKGRTNVTQPDLINLNYLHQVVKEALRLHPPAPMLGPRLCRETCRISGYDIPKGATVLVNVWAVGRDPKVWEDPEEFIPERFDNSNVDVKGNDYELIPFGAGRRICPGLLSGLTTVELAVANLLYHFDWKLPDGAKFEELDMSESFGITTRRKTPLNLLAIPYELSM